MLKPVLAVVLLSAASVSSVAYGDRGLTPLESSVVSAKCASLASFGAPTPGLAFEARVSVASCVASERLDKVPRMAPTLVTSALADAAEPAIAMIDDVIKTAGSEHPGVLIIAQTAKANIYGGLITRARAMIPSEFQVTGTRYAMLREAHEDLEAQLAPWVDREEAALSAVASTGRMHPELNRNPVIQTAIRDSNTALDATPLSATR